MIVESKMNFDPLDLCNYLNNLPRNTWIRFDSIPKEISTCVINSLDSGYKYWTKVMVDEFYERFFLTDEEDHLGMALILKKEH
jgi:hypothetical protein